MILAAITNGFRELLPSRGEQVAGKKVRSLVPVSVRGREGEGLPRQPRVRDVGRAFDRPRGSDRAARAVSEQMNGLKESRQALGGQVLTSLGGFAPPTLLELGTRVAARLRSG